MHFDQPLPLECGNTLPVYDIAYETYGELNDSGSNAVLIRHALSGDQHAAGYHAMEDRKPGWWESCIGPGKPIDTRCFFVVNMNNLGGCKGSSGPNTKRPSTDKYWGPDFPIVTVRDWVNSQQRLMQVPGIKQWLAVIGDSISVIQAGLNDGLEQYFSDNSFDYVVMSQTLQTMDRPD